MDGPSVDGRPRWGAQPCSGGTTQESRNSMHIMEQSLWYRIVVEEFGSRDLIKTEAFRPKHGVH